MRTRSKRPGAFSGLVLSVSLSLMLALLTGCRGSSGSGASAGPQATEADVTRPQPAAPAGATAPAVLPSLREQAAISNGWLKERFDTILPALMRHEKIDMWIVICREHAEDPVFPTLMPRPNMFAWRLMMLVFFDLGGAAGVERISVNPYGSGAFNREIGDFYAPGWTEAAEEPWARLARLVRERDPRRIGIDESRTFAFADGLSATLKSELVTALGPDLSGRLVSAEGLAVGWLETRTSGEIELFGRLARINRDIAAEALSAAVIRPGVTSLDDLSWWTRARFAAIGVEPWFQPTFYILRRAGEPAVDPARPVIRPGDVVRCDIGFSALGMTTDVQEVAYVLRPGETEAPAGLRRALALGNRLQDILAGAFKEGRTGNEVLATALAQARADGLEPRVYSHPLNYYGHGAGPKIGLGDMQTGVPGAGDYPVHADTCWAIELGVAAAVPEWGGQKIQMALEQSAVFTGSRVSFAAGRQTAFHLVR